MDNNSFNTFCKGCIFAETSDNIQTGCKLDRLRKFKDNGGDIAVISYDDGSRYYGITNRICSAHRGLQWGNKTPKRKWVKTVESELIPKVDIVINIKKGDDIESIYQTMENAFSQTKSAATVIFAVDQQNTEIDPLKIVGNLVSSNESRTKWRVEEVDLEKTLKYCKSEYIAVFNTGSVIPNDLIDRIHKYLNIELKRFVLATSKDGYVMKNIPFSKEHVEKQAALTNTEYLIITINELINE